MVSRRERNEKRVREDIESKYGLPIWFPVLEENKYGYGFPYCSHGLHVYVYIYIYIYIYIYTHEELTVTFVR